MVAALAASAFVASALVLVPLPWHLQSRNIPVLSIIAWLFVLNVSYGVNALIWGGNVEIVLPIWCDIDQNWGHICAAVLMLVPSTSPAYNSKFPEDTEQRSQRCRGGCSTLLRAARVNHGPTATGSISLKTLDAGPRCISFLSLLLVDLPPAVASLLALVYCGLALFYFLRRRIVITRMINSSDTVLTTSRYIRLMSMTAVLGMWNAIIIGIGIWATYGGGFRPWTSWSDVHFNFSRIQPYPIAILPEGLLRLTYLLWAAVPISSFFFFIFFSFGGDALKEYKHLIKWIGHNVLGFDRKLPPPETDTTSLYATSLGTFSDGRFNASSREPSHIRSFTPASSPYNGHDSSSAAEFLSNGTLMPLYPAKEADFYHRREFWAM
ncbi:pheromone A receptor-domain-containing protein [Mycena albidolilacea]|uniref:Pheromone A receptor-domain-containing protein n=1 Tax=Mycena albidolilacea TaxID=1033008 RepID=A0AAD7F2P6_9AGAR|nr:pheromone A receptor-domain-containing protein [Mycena albidolilacea]